MLCMLCPDGVRFISVLEVYHILWSFPARPGFCWVRRKRLNPAYGDKMGYGYGNKALAKLNPVYGEQNLLKQGRLG
ncbi:MAG: hypothetical protein ACPGD7_17260 [bacterium]